MSFLKIFFLFIVSITVSINCVAQTNINSIGKIEMIENNSIKELMQKQVEINSKIQVKGYRIKIHFGSDKTKAKEIKLKFISKFPAIPAYEKYDQPNFNIRVGNFRTKLDGYKQLKEILIEFPGAFIVQDEIELYRLE